MVTKDQMMSPMLIACPSFRTNWSDFLEEYKNESRELPLYLALSDRARHLVGMLARNETAAFPAIFNVVEQWHLHGDSYVKEAATVYLKIFRIQACMNQRDQNNFGLFSVRSQTSGGTNCMDFGSEASCYAIEVNGRDNIARHTQWTRS